MTLILAAIEPLVAYGGGARELNLSGSFVDKIVANP